MDCGDMAVVRDKEEEEEEEEEEVRGYENRDQEAESDLVTLQSMTVSVKMGKPVEEEEIPPPFAVGYNSTLQDSTAPIIKGGPRLQLPFEAASSNDRALLGAEPVSSHTSSQPEASLKGVKDMVLSREREFRLAAVHAKRAGDVEFAKRQHTAKKLDLVVEASIQGEHVDVSSLPPPPGEASPLQPFKYDGDVESLCSSESLTRPLPQSDISETALDQQADGDPGVSPATCSSFESSPTATITGASGVIVEQDPFPDLSHSLPVCSELSDQYRHILDILDQQHKRCHGYCQQFTHMGKVAETVRIIPALTGSDMVLTVIKGINLPVPAELSPNDMDVSVRFEFAFPSLEDAQRDQTCSVKNSTCPEFNEHFKLHIKRDHRGFKRIIQSKGIKLEIMHKGGLFKTDKVIGSAVLRLDTLERLCEIRQLIEVLSRRKPTGGFLEVGVRIREPLGGPQLHTVTEPWLTLNPLSLTTMAAAPESSPQTNTDRQVSSSSSICRVL